MDADQKMKYLRAYRARSYDFALWMATATAALALVAILNMSTLGRIGFSEYFAFGSIITISLSVLSGLFSLVSHLRIVRLDALVRVGDVEVLGRDILD